MKRSLALVLLTFALVAAACSGETADPASPSGAPSTAGSEAAGATTATGASSESSDSTTTSTASTETTSPETTTTASQAPATSVASTTTTSAPDDESTETTTTTTLTGSDEFPVTVISDAGPTTIEAPPVRIAALSATHVEMLYALGAGDRIVAVDLFSNFPEDAAAKAQLDAFNLNVEEVIATDPDLVVLSFDPVGALEALESLGIPTLLLGTATTIESAYLQMAVLGSATGLETESEALVKAVSEGIAEVVAATGDAGQGLAYYHESDPFTFYTPTSLSFIGQIYGLFGMENIADAAPDAAGQTFPQLTPEYIVDSDPTIIFSTDPSGDVSVYTDRVGWGSMSAVTSGAVAFLDADIASRWGPRLVDLVAAIAEAIQANAG